MPLLEQGGALLFSWPACVRWRRRVVQYYRVILYVISFTYYFCRYILSNIVFRLGCLGRMVHFAGPWIHCSQGAALYLVAGRHAEVKKMILIKGVLLILKLWGCSRHFCTPSIASITIDIFIKIRVLKMKKVCFVCRFCSFSLDDDVFLFRHQMVKLEGNGCWWEIMKRRKVLEEEAYNEWTSNMAREEENTWSLMTCNLFPMTDRSRLIDAYLLLTLICSGAMTMINASNMDLEANEAC